MTGVACGLQNRYGAFTRPGWVRFPHVPAILCAGVFCLAALPSEVAGQPPETADVVSVQDTVPPVTPLGALARSMVLPGWGQLEVGRPARGAFYFAAEVTFLYMVFASHGTLSAAREAQPQNEDLISARTRQRENWIVLAVFVAFVSGLDAWVSTHFWDFEPAITAPVDGSPGVGLSITVDFP